MYGPTCPPGSDRAYGKFCAQLRAILELIFREIVSLGDQSGFGNAKPGVQFMKTFLVATSAIALLATMSIALAQAPKGEGGQKEMSQPPMKEGPSAEKDTPKAGERKETPADKKAQQDKAPKDAAKDTAKDGTKEPSGKEKASKDAPKDGKKEAADKDRDRKDASKEAGGKDKATKEGKGGASLLRSSARRFKAPSPSTGANPPTST